MTAIEKIAPVWAIECDRTGCFRLFIPETPLDRHCEHFARTAARDAGWQVRPNRGKGARSAPDLCPEHAD